MADATPTKTAAKRPGRQPMDHQPKGGAAVPDAVPGVELLKPLDAIPVWDQADFIQTVTAAFGDIDEDQVAEGNVRDFDISAIGHVARKMLLMADDPDKFEAFLSGPGALQRTMTLGVWLANRLGESEASTNDS